MTPAEIKAAAETMLAYAAMVEDKGRDACETLLQYRRRRSDGELEFIQCPSPVWDWNLYEYRIKPEPREWWLRFNERDELICLELGQVGGLKFDKIIHVREVTND